MSRLLSVVASGPEGPVELFRTCAKCRKKSSIPRGHITDGNQFYCMQCHAKWVQLEEEMARLGRGQMLPDGGECTICHQWKSLFTTVTHHADGGTTPVSNAEKCRSCWRRVSQLYKPKSAPPTKRARTKAPTDVMAELEPQIWRKPEPYCEDLKVAAAVTKDSTKTRPDFDNMASLCAEVHPGYVHDTLEAIIYGIHQRDMENAVRDECIDRRCVCGCSGKQSLENLPPERGNNSTIR